MTLRYCSVFSGLPMIVVGISVHPRKYPRTFSPALIESLTAGTSYCNQATAGEVTFLKITSAKAHIIRQAKTENSRNRMLASWVVT